MAEDRSADEHALSLQRVLELIPPFVQQWERDARTIRWPEALAGGLLDVRALRQVARDPGLTAGELARELWLSGSAVTAVLNRLERAGLIVRGREPRDRRVVRLALTDLGRVALERAEATRIEHMTRRFAALSSADLDRLAAILQRMIRAWDGGAAAGGGR